MAKVNCLPSTGCPAMVALPKSVALMTGGCGAPGSAGSAGMFGIPGKWGIPGRCGAGSGSGTIFTCCFRWSSTIACPAAGLVITDMLGKSTRILPSLAFNICVACCVGGTPGAEGCMVVTQFVQEGGFGSAMAEGYHDRSAPERRRTTIGY